ncbi:MAG TPA: SpoIIE family protein phosphatase [Roseiflexaceae bacterium]|nr:SpoIIE family protein phosphatase [Roseiflexaceae bacterium]
MSVEWGAVCRAKRGQETSGDTYLVHEHGGGCTLAAVIDGLGGGEEAARAARIAETLLRERAEHPLQELVRQSHAALHATRGAVAGLLRLEAPGRSVSYVGVGNVGVHVYSRQPIKPISKNGILGYRLPTLLELRYAYEPGDIFVLYSDGVSSQFGQDSQIDLKQPPQQLAEQILARYGKLTDDATVLVLRTL